MKRELNLELDEKIDDTADIIGLFEKKAKSARKKGFSPGGSVNVVVQIYQDDEFGDEIDEYTHAVYTALVENFLLLPRSVKAWTLYLMPQHEKHLNKIKIEIFKVG